MKSWYLSASLALEAVMAIKYAKTAKYNKFTGSIISKKFNIPESPKSDINAAPDIMKIEAW